MQSTQKFRSVVAAAVSRRNNLKSAVVKDRFYIECSCTSTDHLLVFDFWNFGKEHNYTEMSAQFVSPYHDSFWKRLGYFFKYLFNKDRYLGTSDAIIFNRKNLEQLKEVVGEMEEILFKQEREQEKRIKIAEINCPACGYKNYKVIKNEIYHCNTCESEFDLCDLKKPTPPKNELIKEGSDKDLNRQ